MGVDPHAWIGVAFSGGRDSGALLHAALRACGRLGIGVHALHVHHGLIADADTWLAHCEARCRSYAEAGLAVRFAERRLAGRPARGESVEAWARTQRYAALGEMARAAGVALVLLAHHRRDQAETFLLQALRGGGVAGLAAMPRHVVRDGITWARPWLATPREDIEAYAEAAGLASVDDPSNLGDDLARSRLRGAPWAALTGAFPQAEIALAASAAHAADAAALLAEVAAEDLAAIAADDSLEVAAWLRLSPARRVNVLRAWLAQRLGAPAPATLLVRLLEEVHRTGTGRWPAPGGELCLHRGRLVCRIADAGEALPRPVPISLRRAGTYRAPGWPGRLRVQRVAAGGVALDDLAAAELRPRLGGERFQAGPGRPPRSLKKQFQAAGLAAWQRDGPLLYAGDRLVFVAGLGVDARAIAAPGVAQVHLDWLPAGTA